MRRWPLLVILLGACNQVYDLVPTRATDSDHDGVFDGQDNCLLVANTDQHDTDGDSLGDACDPCPAGAQSGIDSDHDGIDDACDSCLTGKNTDEDRDGVLDGCDLCPGDADPDQADADLDGIGDACDPSAVPNKRVAFEGFDPPRPGWSTGFRDWQATGGSFGPLTPVGARYPGAWHPDLVVRDSGWRIETVVTIYPDPAPVDYSKIVLEPVTDFGGFSNRGCGVVYLQGKWQSAQGAVPVTIGSTIHLRVDEGPTTTQCWIDGTLVSTTTHISSAGVWRPLIETNLRADFQWLDVIQ